MSHQPKSSESKDNSVVRSESGKIERRIERSTLDSAGESSLRGRVISPVGRMSQHVFLMILNKTLLHSKEILVFGVRGDLEKQQPGIFCRSHDDSAIAAGLIEPSFGLCCRRQPDLYAMKLRICVVAVLCRKILSDTESRFWFCSRSPGNSSF